MTLFKAVILGIIQGLTEFLPVSSSGHLVLFSNLFKIKETSLVFEIVVHVGTLISVFVVFWNDVVSLVTSFFKLLKNPKDYANLVRSDPGCALVRNIVLATLPVIILALIFKDLIEQLFTSSLFVGFMLLITGTILFVTERLKVRRKPLDELTTMDALIIGVGQSFAMLPGISRSGTTIAMGLQRGLDRESSARFSFLLTIPAILGALIFSLKDLFKATETLTFGALGVGFLSSAITGYFAIRFLLELIKRGKLVWFSYYTWFIGALVIVLNLV